MEPGLVLVLDTHAAVWVLVDPPRVSKRAVRAIDEAREKAGGIFVSDVTLFEVAMLITRKRLATHVSLESFLKDLEAHFTVLPITREVAARAVQMPNEYPRDPMDRIIGATALVEGLPLLTADDNIQRSKVVKTIW